MQNLRILVALLFTIIISINVSFAQQDPNDFKEKTAEEMMNSSSEKKSRKDKSAKRKDKKSLKDKILDMKTSMEEPSVKESTTEETISREPIPEKPTLTEPSKYKPEPTPPAPPTDSPPVYSAPRSASPVAKNPFGSRPAVKSTPFGAKPVITRPAKPTEPANPEVPNAVITAPEESKPAISQPSIAEPQVNEPEVKVSETKKLSKEGRNREKSERSKTRESKSLLDFGKSKDEDTDGLDLNEKVRIDVGNSAGENAEYGIVGEQAPDFQIEDWWDESGNKANYYVSDFSNKVLILFCWADWCPACKSHGYDEMLAIQDKYLDNPQVEMLGIQTVWEGKMQNTKAKVKKVREKYGFKIPMAYDDGDVNTAYRSSIMTNYKTAGTPWFIVIDKQGKVTFNYHHLPIDATEEVIDSLLY